MENDMTSMKAALMAAVAVGALAMAAGPARAQQSDTAAIRQQIEAMKREYEARIRDLERRLEKTESDAQAAKQAAAQSQATADAAQASANQPPPTPPAAQNAFNPAISAVLNGTYGAFSRDPDKAKIPGFALGDEATPGKRGFSLGESEIDVAANVDQAFSAWLALSFDSDNTASVEEAYIQSSSLPYGFTLKAGRFLSGIGYLNDRHAHDWDFVDAPLPYRAMLNNQYGDDGVQLRWIAPTDYFLEFGGELFRGDAFPAGNGSHAGNGARSLFVHAGDDFNESSSWLAGLSYLSTDATNRETGTLPDKFSGSDDVGIASLVYKWAPDGNPIERNLILSGEYFNRHERGTFDANSLNTNQSGWYLQSVYQFMPRWRAGLRYDELSSKSLGSEFAGTTLDNMGHTPRRETALLEYDTSEFGRFRLQYNHDQSDLQNNDEFLLQYTVIVGPHGAHRF
jgi:outer membrane murein-binding lipoprotein Lpp